MKILLVIIFCFTLLGCNSQSQKVNLGKCIEVRAISTSFNESPKTQVVTDKGFYILDGYYSFDRDQDIIISEVLIIRKQQIIF